MTRVEEMLADGWTVRYHEGNRMTLIREGWMAGVNVAADAMMIFDPAGVAVKVPEVYSWKALLAGRWYCKSCFRTADLLETPGFNKNFCMPCQAAEREALG